MKVRVYAAEGGKIYVHNYRPQIGVPPRYVNRDFVPGDGKTRPAEHPARNQPDEFEFGSPEGQHALREVRKGNLFAADEETARLANVPFKRCEYRDGDWFQTTERAPAPALSKRPQSTRKDPDE